MGAGLRCSLCIPCERGSRDGKQQTGDGELYALTDCSFANAMIDRAQLADLSDEHNRIVVRKLLRTR